MKISIVVPAFNEEKLIERSLQNIRGAAITFSQVGWEHEIIVCDNNSTRRARPCARPFTRVRHEILRCRDKIKDISSFLKLGRPFTPLAG
jgi:cellulose synthase/poly-beta-1,6-N-acetylglucosamine synthase-like glycosyltransferase